MAKFDLRSHDCHEYVRLLDVLPWMTTTVSFVLREIDETDDPARGQCMAALQRLAIERKAVSEWPGTRLFGHTAELLICGNIRSIVEVMKQCAISLYDWVSPLPEDPVFYRADGSPLLVTIAHERGAFVEVSEDEHRLLQRTGIRLHACGGDRLEPHTDALDAPIRTLPSRDGAVPERNVALESLSKRIDNANRGKPDEQWNWPRPNMAAASELNWLMHWYCAQADGDWEHGFGISIETLDNPGWTVRVNLLGTERETDAWDGVSIERSEHDWIFCRIVEQVFEVACGPLNLEEAIAIFREWWKRGDQ